jgi:RimJ/RimL family protein N-acetyltransferase
MLLRPVSPCDLPQLLEHWKRPEVRRYLWDDAVILPECALGVIERSLCEFKQYRYGLFYAQSGGRFAGCFGLRRLDDDAELTYSLEPEFWGQGLAVEGSGAVIDWAFATLQLPRIFAGTDEQNERSLRVIERLGMKPAGHRGACAYFVLEKT